MLSHVEEYHTGTMMYGNSWFGILEVHYMVIAVHLLSAANWPLWAMQAATWQGRPVCE